MFPRGTAAAFGLMAGECRISSREPLRDLRAVSNAIETARLTDGAADIPQAITAAAETLQRSGGGGVIWILTDTPGFRLARRGLRRLGGRAQGP